MSEILSMAKLLGFIENVHVSKLEKRKIDFRNVGRYVNLILE